MLQGRLEVFSVTDVLGLVARTRRAGALLVEGADTAVVYCAGGDITFATAHADETLADVLVQTGFLTAEDWSAASAASEPGVEVAQTLLAKGVDARRLHRLVRVQTEEALFELDQWREGTFRFESDADHALTDAFRHPITGVLTAVADRRRRWDALIERVGSVDYVVAQVPTNPEEEGDLVLSRVEFRVLTAVDGRHSVRQLARGAGIGLFGAAEIVVALLDRGLIRVDPRTAATALDPLPAPSLASVTAGAPGLDGYRAGDGGQAVDGLAHAGANGWSADLLASVNGNGHHLNGNGQVNGYANGHDLNGNGHHVNGNGTGDPAESSLTSGLPAVEFVAPGERPARDLILRLLTAVKEL